MFMPGQEPQLSKEEIRAGEFEAQQTVNSAIVAGILLYLSPFAVDFVKKFL
ncbi:mitochondrial outer membrane translocase complex, subunit Tom5 [Paecilomyces variotii]|uniref:Mitochondrial outer membrane translocase complex, subunit Tom5 n=1 Tax=Byssochlamys spectabilis TaxID=264951 RepID=A0A443HP60_BYSSP|nr:mitochondrial outer membrane translocase complex, subunit Tom5 [Paecilomyces variotii]RWQ93622.1 mitochondrial outer membrane translocase complex, subunit Tom5 [Paecilomyces variotii]